MSHKGMLSTLIGISGWGLFAWYSASYPVVLDAKWVFWGVAVFYLCVPFSVILMFLFVGARFLLRPNQSVTMVAFLSIYFSDGLPKFRFKTSIESILRETGILAAVGVLLMFVGISWWSTLLIASCLLLLLYRKCRIDFKITSIILLSIPLYLVLPHGLLTYLVAVLLIKVFNSDILLRGLSLASPIYDDSDEPNLYSQFPALDMNINAPPGRRVENKRSTSQIVRELRERDLLDEKAFRRFSVMQFVRLVLRTAKALIIATALSLAINSYVGIGAFILLWWMGFFFSQRTISEKIRLLRDHTERTDLRIIGADVQGRGGIIHYEYESHKGEKYGPFEYSANVLGKLVVMYNKNIPEKHFLEREQLLNDDLRLFKIWK